jgi:transglutaminase-like putative cysteine protease
MPIVSIRHQTTYRYRNPVAFGEHRMMLRPMEGPDQRLLSYDLDISPEPSMLREQYDATDAWVSLARFEARARRLVVESRARIDHRPAAAERWNAVDATLGATPFTYDADEAAALAPSMRPHPADDAVAAWARRFLRPVGRTRLATLLTNMTHSLREQMGYEVRLAGAPQSPAATLERGRGSCRDFAVLMIEAARSLGLAARFASGYVYGKGAAVAGEKGGHTHAWARVYLPQCGWMDFDPTNGIVGNAGLIRVAAAADPGLTLPLHGSWRGLRSDCLGMDVTVSISAADADARQPPAALRVAETG